MPYDGKGLNYSTEVLMEARNKLEKGWCQCISVDMQEDGSMQYCMGGAIMYSNDMRDIDKILDLVSNVIRDETSVKCTFVWNDTPGRTKEEVLEMMDKIIVRSMQVAKNASGGLAGFCGA